MHESFPNGQFIFDLTMLKQDKKLQSSLSYIVYFVLKDCSYDEFVNVKNIKK